MKRILQILMMAILLAIPFSGRAETKTNYRNALIMAYSPANNVYEDDNIRFEIYNGRLYASNKTEKTIFLDLAQCFLVHNGSAYPMFSSEQDERHASKAKNTTSIDEYKAIPPQTGSDQNDTFICNLGGAGMVGKYTTTETPSGDFTPYSERFLLLLNEMLNESLSADPKGKNYVGTSYRHLTEDESINNIGVSLGYAFNKKAEEWTPASLSTWVSDVYFAPYYVEMPQDLDKKQKRGFGVKKTEAAKIHVKADSPFEFNQDRSPLFVYDWTGNYNKGTFELKPTDISKVKSKGLGLAVLGTVLTGGLLAPTILLANPEETYYKSVVNFDGPNAPWGKLNYMNAFDLTGFNNQK